MSTQIRDIQDIQFVVAQSDWIVQEQPQSAPKPPTQAKVTFISKSSAQGKPVCQGTRCRDSFCLDVGGDGPLQQGVRDLSWEGGHSL